MAVDGCCANHCPKRNETLTSLHPNPPVAKPHLPTPHFFLELQRKYKDVSVMEFSTGAAIFCNQKERMSMIGNIPFDAVIMVKKYAAW